MEIKFNLNKLSTLNGDHIAWLLSKQPQLIDKFDLSKLDKYNIRYLLASHPQLTKYFNEQQS